MLVSLIKTDGPWLEATIATPHGDLVVMDEFSIDDRFAPGEGTDFDVELSTLIGEEDSWEQMFTGNPDRLKKLNRIDGWRYRAYGQITSIHPVIVDCGFMQISDVLHSHDPRVIGDFISFTVTRLEATLTHNQAGQADTGNRCSTGA